MFLVRGMPAHVHLATRLHLVAGDADGIRAVFPLQGHGRRAMLALHPGDVRRLAVPAQPVALHAVDATLHRSAETLASGSRSRHCY